MTLVLASSSPRRLDLLTMHGLAPEVRPADIDETPRPGEAADDLVLRLAGTKAATVAATVTDDALVIAADTVVVLEGTVLGKPTDRSDARRMLEALSGRDHEVVTGVAVALAGHAEVDLARTTVSFRPLEATRLEWYLDTGEGDDKAGAYGIQGQGALLVEAVHGPYDNVVGLPIVTLDRLLGRLGRSVPGLAGTASSTPPTVVAEA